MDAFVFCILMGLCLSMGKGRPLTYREDAGKRDFYRGLFTKEESKDGRGGLNVYDYGQVEAQQEHYSKTGSDVKDVDNFRVEGKESESNSNGGSWQLDKNFEGKDANFIEGHRGQDLVEDETERVQKAEDEPGKEFEETIETMIRKKTGARSEEDFEGNIAGLLKRESALLITTEGRDIRNGAEDELKGDKEITNKSTGDVEDVIEDGFARGLESEAGDQHTGQLKEILEDVGGASPEEDHDRDEPSRKTKVGSKYKIQIAKGKVHSSVARDRFSSKTGKYRKHLVKYEEKEASDGNSVNVKMEDKLRTGVEDSWPQQWHQYPTPLPRPGRKREPSLFPPKS